jgi:hypothetical protein
VNYLSHKHKIDKKRHVDEFIPTALKVQDWNANGKTMLFRLSNKVIYFLFISIDNSTMEVKLREYQNIICLDGTHRTNKEKMELTIMLVKDDRNRGFPVAFFLSNRMDEIVQEVSFMAIKVKLPQEIKPSYISMRGLK